LNALNTLCRHSCSNRLLTHWAQQCQVLANTFNDVYSQLDAAYTSYTTNQTDTLPFLRAWTLCLHPSKQRVFVLSHGPLLFLCRRVMCAALAAELLGIISDLDRLLATNPNYLLGSWYCAPSLRFHHGKWLSLAAPQDQGCGVVGVHPRAGPPLPVQRSQPDRAPLRHHLFFFLFVHVR